MSGESPLDIAERALALCGPDTQVTVVRERSLMSRFARSAPTQATAIDDTTVDILCVRDGHTASASTNRLDAANLRATAVHADRAARAAARSGRGAYPGLAGSSVPQEHAGFDADIGNDEGPGDIGRIADMDFVECLRRCEADAQRERAARDAQE